MKTLVSALAVASLAGSAFGVTEIGPRGVSFNPATIDRVNNYGDITQYITVVATPIDEVVTDRGTPVYSAIQAGAGYLSATSTPSSPIVGFNDYQMSTDPGPFGAPLTNPTVALDRMRFVGGVSVAGSSMDFYFLQNDSSTATAFSITFASAGNFIYTLFLNGTPGGVQVPTEGYYVSVKGAGAGTAAQFYAGSTLGTGAPTVGAQDTSNDFVFNYGGAVGAVPISERFELQVPAPGAAALMGLAGLVGLRRRR